MTNNYDENLNLSGYTVGLVDYTGAFGIQSHFLAVALLLLKPALADSLHLRHLSELFADILDLEFEQLINEEVLIAIHSELTRCLKHEKFSLSVSFSLYRFLTLSLLLSSSVRFFDSLWHYKEASFFLFFVNSSNSRLYQQFTHAIEKTIKIVQRHSHAAYPRSNSIVSRHADFSSS